MNKNNLTLTLTLILFSVLSLVSAQETTEIKSSSKNLINSLYINSPLGFINGIRIMAEHNIAPDHSIVLSLTKYYGVATPGIQSYLEYRKYSITDKTANFKYAKIGMGQTTVYNGKYVLIGVGFGQQIRFGSSKQFSLQFKEGLKICPAISGDIEAQNSSGFRGLFYIAGPGAFVDLNINCGYRF